MRSIVVVASILVARMASAEPLPPEFQQALDDHHFSEVLAPEVKIHGFLFAKPECARFTKPQKLAAKDRDAFDACIDGAQPRFLDNRMAVVIDADARGYAVWLEVKIKDGKIVELVGADATGKEADLPTVYEGGYSDFEPTKPVQDEIGRDKQIFVEMRLCTDAAGNVTSRRLVSKSGNAKLDAEVEAHFKTIKKRPQILLAKVGTRACRRLQVAWPLTPPAIDHAVAVKETVQPIQIEKIESATPAPNPPKIVAPTLLEPLRIAGTKMIAPDDKTKVAIQASGRDKVVASLKLCLDATGAVVTVKLLRSSGFPTYDALLDREMHGWKYKPYVDHGTVIPVCTAVTFIYSQH